mmetsp:Transcript_18048/g.43455  ORF Transcript_18048/g.43455 Transcript_18048/m.43455 type:complete len:97 (-) Transcript_18048:286-576(-)
MCGCYVRRPSPTHSPSHPPVSQSVYVCNQSTQPASLLAAPLSCSTAAIRRPRPHYSICPPSRVGRGAVVHVILLHWWWLLVHMCWGRCGAVWRRQH